MTRRIPVLPDSVDPPWQCGLSPDNESLRDLPNRMIIFPLMNRRAPHCPIRRFAVNFKHAMTNPHYPMNWDKDRVRPRRST
jgi:hypothetical protein